MQKVKLIKLLFISTEVSLRMYVSMPINPLNVIQLLLVAFQTMDIPDSEVNDAERQLADHFNEILIQAINKFVQDMMKVLTSIINKEQWSFGEAE